MMDSFADTAESLLDRVSTLRVSDQEPASTEAQSLGGAEQEEDCFYDCEESIDSAVECRDRESRESGDCKNRDLQPGLLASQQNQSGDTTDRETDGQTDTPDTEHAHTGSGDTGSGDTGSEEEAVVLGERSTGEERMEGGGVGLGEGAMGKEEEDRWDECAGDEGAMMADGGKDSDSELKEEESVASEFDDELLREAEKDLTEEEKERRREESMALKEKGNSQFKSGEHTQAQQSYTSALEVCPVCYTKERAILFSNRAAARLHLEENEKAIADCTKAMELNPAYVRARLRRAELYEKTDKLDEALEDYQAALQQDPSQAHARDACRRLPQQIQERNEKMKEQVMGQLKDLGNMFLRPFGLSTNNFQVNQDSNTGSYSINFVQNNNNR